MKWFDVILVGALFVIPTAGIAQATQTSPAPPVTPPASTPSPATGAATNATPTTANPGGGTPVSNVADAGVANTPHYIIGPEDNLQVTVWKEPSLSDRKSVV